MGWGVQITGCWVHSHPSELNAPDTCALHIYELNVTILITIENAGLHVACVRVRVHAMCMCMSIPCPLAPCLQANSCGCYGSGWAASGCADSAVRASERMGGEGEG